MPRNDLSDGWMPSVEARQRLRVSTCHLMHLRVEGTLRHRKDGNAYLYAADDVERLLRARGKQHNRADSVT
jgi:hypothetical protein